MNVRERSREAARAVTKYVTGRIAAGTWKPGDKLPTEREFMQLFGSGRNTVRKALQVLESEGLIGREVGRGTYVRDRLPSLPGGFPQPPMVHPGTSPEVGIPELTTILRTASPMDVMELRLMIEPPVIEQAVTRASQQEIELMEDCLRNAQVAQSLEEFEHWDDMLHRSFAQASRNPLLVSVYALIGAVRLEAQWGELKRRTLSDELKAVHYNEHVRIVDAVKARDARGARQEMLKHLTHIKNNMFNMAHPVPAAA